MSDLRDDDPRPRALATPLLVATSKAAMAASEAQRDAQAILWALGGSGSGRDRNSITGDIRCRLRRRTASADQDHHEPVIGQVLEWLASLEAAMDRLASLDALSTVRIDRCGANHATSPRPQMPEVLHEGVAAFLDCADEFTRLHREAPKLRRSGGDDLLEDAHAVRSSSAVR